MIAIKYSASSDMLFYLDKIYKYLDCEIILIYKLVYTKRHRKIETSVK